MKVNDINALPVEQAVELFLTQCHSKRWAEEMAKARPFTETDHLLISAAKIWRKATEEDILEAFKGHAQIGDLNALRNKYNTKTKEEQGQVAQASENTLKSLLEKNQAYLKKFGFIFIVCATGKSAEEMLEILEQRLNNERPIELQNGASEQAKITEIRLCKLLEDS